MRSSIFSTMGSLPWILWAALWYGAVRRGEDRQFPQAAEGYQQAPAAATGATAAFHPPHSASRPANRAR
jgi:hypothetical protein